MIKKIHLEQQKKKDNTNAINTASIKTITTNMVHIKKSLKVRFEILVSYGSHSLEQLFLFFFVLFFSSSSGFPNPKGMFESCQKHFLYYF